MASHATHAVVPAAPLKVAVGHIEHDPLSAVLPLSVPVYPTLQRQSSPPSEPAGLLELASQATQEAVPAAPLKVDAGQIEHDPLNAVLPLSVPVYPVLQRQSSPPSEPAGLSELTSHATQAAVPAAPLKVDDGQIEHNPLSAVMPLSVPVYPVLQRQSSPPSEPAGLSELTSQTTQFDSESWPCEP